MDDALRNLILEWYGYLSSLSARATTEVGGLDQRIGIPLVSAFLLGLVGAAAPCQLTTSVGALAVLGGGGTRTPRARSVVAYVAGKALVYTALGILAVVVGAGLSQASIPVFVAARKALGPLMVVIGLAVAGAIRLSWAPGYGVTRRLRQTARRHAEGAPLLLGVAFGFSFCPTLFALFFGFLIPLALARPDGILYPAIFALGTAMPLLAALMLLSIGGGSLRLAAGRVGRWQRTAAVVAGSVLIVAGLHDTAVYWLL